MFTSAGSLWVLVHHPTLYTSDDGMAITPPECGYPTLPCLLPAYADMEPNEIYTLRISKVVPFTTTGDLFASGAESAKL